MRVLVCSTGGAGHVGPLLTFADALADDGHELRFVVPPELATRVAATGHAYELGAAPPSELLARTLTRISELPPQEAAVLASCELFGRMWTAAMQPAVERAVLSWRPDLVLREPCEYASAAAAEQNDVPHAQVAISLAEVEQASLELAAPAIGAQLARQIHAGPYLSRFPAPLDPSPFPDTRRYREPAAAPSPLPNWWHQDATGPLVYVTFGTVASELEIGRRAHATALDAVRGLPARVLVTTAGARPSQRPPDNVHVEPWVAQDDVLAEAALVVCHGGSGTTFGALAAGVPLVLVPLFADQRANAATLAQTGTALVSSIHAGADGLRAAIDTVLATPTFRRRAEQVQAATRLAPTPRETFADPPRWTR